VIFYPTIIVYGAHLKRTVSSINVTIRTQKLFQATYLIWPQHVSASLVTVRVHCCGQQTWSPSEFA